jgi:hypothetical protein
VADRSLVLFRNNKCYKKFCEYNFYDKIFGHLIDNIYNHWNEEIKIISKLAFAKFVKDNKDLLNRIDDKQIIEEISTINYTENSWDIQFNLKAD